MNIQFAKPYYNVVSEANTYALEEAINVYFEPMPQGGFAIRRRPGADVLETTSNMKAQGIYWCDRKNKLYYVIAGNLYYKDSLINASVLIGSIGNTTNTVVFAEGQKIDTSIVLYIATGDQLYYVDLDTNTINAAENAPNASFVANLNNRFYCNDVGASQDFYITDYNSAVQEQDVTFWASASNPFRAAQKPDALLGVYTSYNEIYLWGSQACEVWQEDGVTPISPMVGSIIEYGCAAPYSFVMADNTLIGLGVAAGKRAVIKLNGRAASVISEPIANKLQAIDKVDDAIGSLCFVGGLNAYVINFPTANQTWVYDLKTEVWSQWSSWLQDTGEHNQYFGRFQAYAKAWNQYIVLGANGNLYKLSRESYSDNGNIISSSIRTGWIDHGTSDRKRSDQLIIKVKAYSSDPGKIMMRFRNDGLKEWSNPIELEMQYNFQNDALIKLNRMGTYRSRQYEFVLTDAINMALISMEEDITRMRF